MGRQALPDTSCLILFYKLGRLDLLYKVYGTLTITPEVSEEFRLTLPDWIYIEPHNNIGDFDLHRKIVDYGEASIITLATDKEAPLLIMDDKKGRKLAQALNIELTATLSTLLKAKKSGLVSTVKPLLKTLKTMGLRASPELERFILDEAGE